MKKTFFILIAVFAVMTACQKDHIEGPELQDIFGEFEIISPLEASTNQVDFENGETVQFTAALTIRTDWKITITGLTTGARKEILGRERDILGDVAEWDGTITFAPIFAAEPCIAMMTFDEYPDTMFTDTIHVASPKPTADIQLLISDFEDANQGFLAFTEPVSFNQHVEGSYFQNLFSTPPGFTEVFPAQGNGYWVSTANNSGSLFICGMSLEGANAQQDPPSPYFEFGNQNPDHVYFNAFIFGFGDGNTRFVVGFQEDDNLDGEYDRFTEGTWQKEVLVDWEGWKKVSFDMGETNLSTAGGFGNIDGTGQRDLDRVINIEFLLLAAEGSSGLTGFCLDYLNTTLFEPYKP